MQAVVVNILKALTMIFVVLLLVSSFLFNRRGHITRKTLLLTLIFFILAVASAWLTAVLTYHESIEMILGSLSCMGGLLIIVAVFWAILYWRLPHLEKWVDKPTRSSDD